MFRRNHERDVHPPDRLAFARPSVPLRACCCPARPVVKVIMPPTPSRPHPVDLWLCGHHYRASLSSLQLAGASVEDFSREPDRLPVGEPVAAL